MSRIRTSPGTLLRHVHLDGADLKTVGAGELAFADLLSATRPAGRRA